MDPLQETFGILNKAKERSDACLVSFSAGKDSLCVLDMCVRTFARVEAFFMYFIPGLEVIERRLELARSRYGVTIHQVPHWTVARSLKYGFYMFPSWKLEDLPEVKLRDIYNLMIDRTGIKMIATGARRGDSLWRKRNLANTAHYTDVMHPLVGWGKADVLGYLAVHKIPLPESSGGAMTGIGLATPDVLWLHDKFPNDYAKLRAVFPFVHAIVKRREFYGVGI
jgi:3'-phosphoadenosine 5'-phosphosulfate sulfotransferase (PAPS reductase)/FAD synthetase